MSKKYAVFPADELIDGEIRTAALPDGTRIALYRLNDAFYATQDICTHENASLSEDGAIEDDVVVCGWHFCAFRIATGEVMSSPCSEPLQTYPLHIIDGMIHVEA